MDSTSMQVVTSQAVSGKKVLLRYDIDVTLEKFKIQNSKFKVKEDFKIKAGLQTLNMCLENAAKVIMIGHMGRPEGRVVEELRAEPVREWFYAHGYKDQI